MLISFLFSCSGEIYYRVCSEIEPGTELLVYYGDSYASELGIEPFKKF